MINLRMNRFQFYDDMLTKFCWLWAPSLISFYADIGGGSRGDNGFTILTGQTDAFMR